MKKEVLSVFMNNLTYTLILVSTGSSEKATLNIRSISLGQDNNGKEMTATALETHFLSMVEAYAAAKAIFELLPVVESMGVYKGGKYIKQIYRGDFNEKK